MRIAVTGGTGLVGRFVVERLRRAGHEVAVFGRSAGALPSGVEHRAFDLGAAGDVRLGAIDALVHAALDHVPGRYRGGEGPDAAGFLSKNLGGTLTLFRVARDAGVGRVILLSSRAVYGDYPAGTPLSEDLPPRPDTLYGRVKREAEVALSRMAGAEFAAVSLRATGVYGPAGPGHEHKWTGLFESFAGGDPIAPQVATEVHGDDLAAAVDLFLNGPARSGIFNVSDILVDRADLLAMFSRTTGIEGRLPERADAGRVSVMSTERLRGAGWAPGGAQALERAIAVMARPWMRGERA